MPRPKVALRVDAHPLTGVGHAIRSLALAQEFLSRGVPVTVYGELAVDWVADAYRRVAVPVRPAASLADAAPTHAVLDGYDLPPDLGRELRTRAVRVLALVDGEFGAAQVADVYVDQNVGASQHQGGPDGSESLAGPRFALLRDDVLRAREVRRHRARTTSTPSRPNAGTPQVLAVFGGTDPFDAAGTLVPLLLGTGAPICLTVVSPADRACAPTALSPGAGQHVSVVGALSDLPAAAAAADLVVTAAGSTVWELLTIGVPTAVVAVVDNQVAGYTATTSAGLVAGAGHLPLLKDPSAGTAERAAVTATLRHLLTDTAARNRLASTATSLFDGAGRIRVADALLGPGTRG